MNGFRKHLSFPFSVVLLHELFLVPIVWVLVHQIWPGLRSSLHRQLGGHNVASPKHCEVTLCSNPWWVQIPPWSGLSVKVHMLEVWSSGGHVGDCRGSLVEGGFVIGVGTVILMSPLFHCDQVTIKKENDPCIALASCLP